MNNDYMKRQELIKGVFQISEELKRDLRIFFSLKDKFFNAYSKDPYKLRYFNPNKILADYHLHRSRGYRQHRFENNIDNYAACLCFIDVFVELNKLKRLEDRLKAGKSIDINFLLTHYSNLLPIHKNARETTLYLFGREDKWPHSKTGKGHLNLIHPFADHFSYN